MARVRSVAEPDLDSPVLVEGLPGVGLVGKITTDHLVDTFEMEYVASIECDGVPRVAIYDADDHDVLPPVRLYADESRDLLALQSDVPVTRQASVDFSACFTEWLASQNATPLYLSGLPVEDHDPETLPDVFGVATSDTAAERLRDHDIPTPPERGLIGGPTGALVNRAAENGVDATGLVVESDPQFPDPAAAKRLIDAAVEPLADVDVPTDELVDRAEEIRDQKERLAKRMQEASQEESTQARPMRMFQ
ncbi:proteasome assembly chaperone family protein [Halobacterium yunchengense]|uniref:proteasome assembly chaperone family protein n=1 Tax=Halobacterium yunchengense TaxID=3108497 RepID=UPI0030091F35